MKQDSVTVLITGASRGIGLELCRQYAKYGLTNGIPCKVIATCRKPDNAMELKQLLGEEGMAGNVEVLALDVADVDSVQELRVCLAERPIDLLINNAGMYGPNAPLLPVDIEQWHKVFHLNCVAPLYLSQQLFKNIQASQLKKIITISSDMGSIAANAGGGAYLYRSSKAGLNAAMYSLSLDVKPLGVTVGLIHPGHVKTDLGGPNAKVDVTDSVTGIRKTIDELNLMHSGAFKNWLGETLPW